MGISKVARICVLLAKTLQLQESYTAMIADLLVKHLKTPDVAVVVKGQHDCMRIRGIKDEGTEVIVSEMRGEFRAEPTLRAEFLMLIES